MTHLELMVHLRLHMPDRLDCFVSHLDDGLYRPAVVLTIGGHIKQLHFCRDCDTHNQALGRAYAFAKRAIRMVGDAK